MQARRRAPSQMPLALTLTALAALGLAAARPARAQTITIGPTANGAAATDAFGSGFTTVGAVFTAPDASTLNSFALQGTPGYHYNVSLYGFNTATSSTTGTVLFTSKAIPGKVVPGAWGGAASEYDYQTGPLALTPGGSYIAVLSNDGTGPSGPPSRPPRPRTPSRPPPSRPRWPPSPSPPWARRA